MRATNDCRLSGDLIETEPLRYTPARVPVWSGRIAHRSRQVEAGIGRDVACQAEVVAVGDMAVQLATARLGSQLALRGFLAPRRRGGRALALHVNEIEAVGEIDTEGV
ncbi:MAG TPA: primosomal replication protein N [Rhodocyclaceae bacterium]|nr:primosomal replication protein N [Rhodocyclaceae bacterium]